ncbi:MAG: CRISPR-associated endonuclease Cas1 [Cyclobacteriaceae bacterium]|nr:CRISPR-associated endonuclease Cas1 [Cyclobacteriaceae bacterium]
MQIFINTYGTYVHVKDEMFEIRLRTDPKEKVKINHIASHKATSFIMSKGASISTDAIALAIKNNIDIVIVESDGHPIGRFWHSKLGSTTKIRKRQLEASLNEEGLLWIKKWITQKLENQADYIQDLKKHRKQLSDFLEEKQSNILEYREKISHLRAPTVGEVAETIRGWEGSAGRQYFDALAKAIPEEFIFQGRSFRPAKNPFNAMLNYAYGILYSRVERALMIAGLDPYVGFLHRDDYNMKSLVFDFIEPFRIHAERCVFTLFSTKKVKRSFFDQLVGGFTLNPEGKPFLVEHFMRYMDQDTIRYRGRNQTRFNALQMDAHAFANELISKSNDFTQ